MNKKEQQQMEDMKQELRLVRALRFTDKVEFDVPPPSGYSGALTTGYHAWSYGSGPSVEVACSSSTSHAYGSTVKTNSQGCRSLYSTKLLALRALRYGVEQECASRLARVDAMIEAEVVKVSK